jgi:hypothetical protein
VTPHPSRLSPTHPRWREIVAAHERAVALGDPTYADPVSGLSVFTATYHLERGSCCESGCRHCPYI